MKQKPPPACEIFKTALEREVRSLESLDSSHFLEAVVEIVQTPECDVDPDRLMIDHLSDRAAEGSIRAAAALLVLSWSDPRLEPRVIEAMTAIAHRSPDVTESVLVAGLTALLEEELQEWVRAGKAVRIVDPVTGEVRYGPPPKSKAEDAA